MADELQGTPELLPVGSVVELRDGGGSLVMVLGFEPEVDGVVADYLGVPYPMGLVSDDAALAFDAEAVSEVRWRGYWDDEGDAALEAVRHFRTAASEAQRRLQELVDSLDAERFVELREQYTFGRFAEEPEPDLLDDDSSEGFDAQDGAPQWADAEADGSARDFGDDAVGDFVEGFDDYEDADEPDFLDDIEDEPEPELPDL